MIGDTITAELFLARQNGFEHGIEQGRRQAFEEALALVNKYQHMLTNPVSEIIEKLEEMKK